MSIPFDSRFSKIEGKNRVWAIASVFGKNGRLKVMHEVIASDIKDGDYFVYMGNMIGDGGENKDVFADMMAFKNGIKKNFSNIKDDNFIYLRGAQEEMWQKLLQLHLAHKPEKIYRFLMDNGISQMLDDYGFSAKEGEEIIDKGTVALSHWTSQIRDRFYESEGYNQIFNRLKHAAFCEDKSLLFVNAGVDHSKTLEQHKDEFWWAAGDSFTKKEKYQDFRTVVRGFAKGLKQGIYNDELYITLGSGSSKNSNIYAGLFNEDRTLAKVVEV